MEVSRNGVPDYSFAVDAASGSLTLGVAPGLDEEIRVSYLRESSDRSTGSLAAGPWGLCRPGRGPEGLDRPGPPVERPRDELCELRPGRPRQDSPHDRRGGSGGGPSPIALPWRASGRRARLAAATGSTGWNRTRPITSPIVPLSGGGDFTALEIKESRLASQWPSLEAGLHSDGSAPEGPFHGSHGSHSRAPRTCQVYRGSPDLGPARLLIYGKGKSA